MPSTNYSLVKPTRILLARKFFLCCAIAWTLLIALLCLIDFNQLPKISIGGADKYVHVTFHFGFTLLWFQALKNGNGRTVFKVAAASFLYGIGIEIAQGLFTLTRHADIYDVMANTTGALMAVAVIRIYEFYGQKNTNQ